MEGTPARTIRDAMHKGCECIGESQSLLEAAKRMEQLDIGVMPICGDDERVKGMLTDRDIVVKALAHGMDPATTRGGELAQGKLVWIGADASFEEALSMMREHAVKRLPVMDENKRLCGILTEADIATHAPGQKTGELLEAIASAPRSTSSNAVPVPASASRVAEAGIRVAARFGDDAVMSRVRITLGLCAALLSLCAASSSARPLRINELQSIGTHNSYHVEPSPAEKALRSGSGAIDETTLEYSFAPLAWQLGRQDVRHLELDLFADPQGGAYAAPRLRTLAGDGPYDPAMQRPGIKVLHVQDYDYRTTCLTLIRCLRAVRSWSDVHRGHVPIAIQLELKDVPLPPQIPSTVPPPWTPEQMDAIDREILAVFARRRIIAPDDVRGRRGTLEAAVLRDGWPALAASRGKVLFLMDNGEPYRSRYLEGHPALAGRLLFTNSVPGRPDAAFVKENDPTGASFDRIRDEVRRGYIVRTRADADTREARADDTRRRGLALASGAQWVSTDYPAPGIAARFGSDYSVRLPGDRPARCNPLIAPKRCRSARLDRG